LGEQRGFNAAADVELLQDVGHVVLHGLFRQEEPFSDLAVGEADTDELEDLGFS
jgi:hypothetical protein